MQFNQVNAFLTVRADSSRLPDKWNLPFGETNVLGHIASRCINASIIPIICTSVESSDDKIADFAIKNKIKYFRGSLKNKVHRWLECANSYNIPKFHVIDGDDLFFEPALVFESMATLENCELDVVFPTKESSSGSASVGYSISNGYLEKNSKSIKNIECIEMVDVLFNSDPNLRSQELVTLMTDSKKLRLTLDYQEDYYLLKLVLQILGPNCTRSEILDLFLRNPDLHELNWFRNSEWGTNQENIRTSMREVIKIGQ